MLRGTRVGQAYIAVTADGSDAREAVVALKDISPLHNSALFILLDGIFATVTLEEKLPTNFKKMIENFVDVGTKTKHKPSAKTLELLDKYKENASLKTLIKQIANL